MKIIRIEYIRKENKVIIHFSSGLVREYETADCFELSVDYSITPQELNGDADLKQFIRPDSKSILEFLKSLKFSDFYYIYKDWKSIAPRYRTKKKLWQMIKNHCWLLKHNSKLIKYNRERWKEIY